MALVDKPTNALDQRGERPTPVLEASELEEHRQTPSVEARLQRAAAIVESRRRAGITSTGQ